MSLLGESVHLDRNDPHLTSREGVVPQETLLDPSLSLNHFDGNYVKFHLFKKKILFIYFYFLMVYFKFLFIFSVVKTLPS